MMKLQIQASTQSSSKTWCIKSNSLYKSTSNNACTQTAAHLTLQMQDSTAVEVKFSCLVLETLKVYH